MTMILCTSNKKMIDFFLKNQGSFPQKSFFLDQRGFPQKKSFP